MSDKVTDRTAKIVALLQEKVQLEPWHRRLFYIVFGVLWGSGSLWLLIEWFKDPELGAARTLLQTVSMKVHGATMLVYLALLGTLIAHIRRGTALKANRLSGFTMIALNGVLALSGWLLYYVSDDAVREFSSAIHWAIGLIALPLLCAHILAGQGWSAKLLDLDKPSGSARSGAAKRRDNDFRRNRA
jgi:hypothetical protein